MTAEMPRSLSLRNMIDHSSPDQCSSFKQTLTGPRHVGYGV